MCEQSSAASADSRAGFPWQLPSSIKHLRTVYSMGRWDKSSNSVQDSCKEGKNSFSIMLPGETRQEAMHFESQADLNPVRSGAGTPECTPPCPTEARPSAWSSPASSSPSRGSHWTWRWLFPTGVPFTSKGPRILGAASWVPALSAFQRAPGPSQGEGTFPLSLAAVGTRHSSPQLLNVPSR